MKNIETYYEKDSNLYDIAYDFGNNNLITFKTFWNGRKISEYYPVKNGTCGTNILGILADGNVSLCCIDYEGFTGIGNVKKQSLIEILKQKKKVIDGVQTTGKLQFNACKRCLGSPTKLGSFLKNVKWSIRKK